MEQPSGNPSELWKSPRGTVIRIEVLALVAIAMSFFFVAFGSSRRWSNCWIIQKGVLAANALSLSLGTYSIGLMQSSPVKSEMYPIWAVSLLTLFGSIDSISGYNLDHNSQFLKLLYQLCLYCGYVLLIGISTISSDVGNIAVSVLCAITFIKGFHRSLASVLPSRLRNVNKLIADYMEYRHEYRYTYGPVRMFMTECPKYVVDWPLDKVKMYPYNKRIIPEDKEFITIDKILNCISLPSYKDICISFSLCHLLQRRFFGFTCADSGSDEPAYFVNKYLLARNDRTISFSEKRARPSASPWYNGEVDCERTFKVIEVELAFLYDIFFTNNAFLHYYESKVATIWTFASIIGIIFVGVVTVIPGTRRTNIAGGTTVVATTPYDLVITLVILVCIALLQVIQLVRSWTSNWARVALVCQRIRNGDRGWLMRFKAILCRTSRSNNNVWQRRLGQHSFVESISTKECVVSKHMKRAFTMCVNFARIFGLRYIEQVYEEMFGSPSGLNHVGLTTHMKEAIVDSYMRIVGAQEKPTVLGNYYTVGVSWHKSTARENILVWHIATCYLEMGQSKNKKWLDEHYVEEDRKKLAVYFDVATTLSKYYAYLIVSAPELLPLNPFESKSAYNAVAREARGLLRGVKDKYDAMRCLELSAQGESVFRKGADLGRRLESLSGLVLWKELAEFWADSLIYAAPSDNVKEHIDRLARGGEFITHLWALLFHAGIVQQNQVVPASRQEGPDIFELEAGGPPFRKQIRSYR